MMVTEWLIFELNNSEGILAGLGLELERWARVLELA